MKRLYLPIDKYVTYNEAVTRLMVQSEILNQGSMFPNSRMSFFDREGILSKLLEIAGDGTGHYMKNGQSLMASIPTVQLQLKEIEKQFDEYKKMKVNQGYDPVTTMPINMLDKYYFLKAKITVLMEEESTLRKWEKSYTDEKQKEDDSKVLAWGLRGFGRSHGTRTSDPKLRDVLAEIDGQKCTLSPEGILYIDDPRTPYNFMYVSSFRKLCKEWQAQRCKEEEEAFKLFQEQCRNEGLPTPKPTVKSPSRVSKQSLPPFPVWAKRYVPDEVTTKK